MLKENKEF